MGRVLIRKDQTDFIDEWIDYDSELKNPKDDVLDSTEIALRTAGILLMDTPLIKPKAIIGIDAEWQEFLKTDIEYLSHAEESYNIDPDMGEDY